jgi:hypothetical protein
MADKIMAFISDILPNAPAETTTTIGTLINGATAKTTTVDADMIPLMDSEATNVVKKLSWAYVKSILKTYFDGIYAAAASYLTDIVNDTTPQLGGNLDMNGKCIDYGAVLSTNGTFKGPLITGQVDTNAVGIGAVLAIASDGNWDEADADAIANTYMLAMATSASTGAGQKLLLEGMLCNTAWSWTAGSPLYLSVTQGTMSHTPVAGEDDVSICVGWAMSTTCVYFKPYSGWVTYKA